MRFRFEHCYCAIDENSRVLMQDGGRMETFEFYLHTGGRVIGPCDMSAADHETWAAEWRNACADRRLNVA